MYARWYLKYIDPAPVADPYRDALIQWSFVSNFAFVLWHLQSI